MDNRFRNAVRALFLTSAIAGVAATGLIACGGDDSSSGTTTPPAPPPVPPGTAPTPPPVNPPVNPPNPPPNPDGGMEAGPQKAPTPTCSPMPGMFTTTTDVSLSTTPTGFDIFYTTDGTNPTNASVVFSSPLSIAVTTTVRAMAGKTGFTNSDVAVCTYTINSSATQGVTFSPLGGTFPNIQAVGMSSESGATICYTTDGSAPGCDAPTAKCTGTSATYNAASPVTISTGGTTVKALACKVGKPNSGVSTATYNYTAAVPVASPGDPGAVTNLTNAGSLVQLSTVTNGGVIHYTTDGSTPTCGSGFTITDTGFVNGGTAITQNTTIKALTCKTGFTPSAVQTFNYTVMAPDVTISPAAGTYDNDTPTSFTGSACYETNNANPDPACNAAGSGCASGTFTGGAGPTITADNTTVRFIGCSANHSASNPGTPATYNLKAGKPAIQFTSPTVIETPNSDLDATQYDSAPSNAAGTANFTSTTVGAQIRYRLDGSAPTPCSAAAVAADHAGTTPLNGQSIPNPSSLTAIACKANYQQSDEHAATYANSTAQITFNVVAGGTVTEAPATGADPFDMTVTGLNPPDSIVCYTVGAQTNPDCDAAGTVCTAGTQYNAGAPPQVTNDGDFFTVRACHAGLGKSFIHQFQYHLQARRPAVSPAAGTVPLGTVVNFSEPTNDTTGWNPTTDATPGIATAAPTFHYTTSNSGAAPADPTCATPTTGNSFLLVQNPTWIKVLACKANHAASAVRDAGNYTVTAIGDPTFTPPGNCQGGGNTTVCGLPETQNVHISTVSGGVPNSVICYTTGNANGQGATNGSQDPATDPVCSPTHNGCTTGTTVTAATGVDVSIAPGANQHTFVKAIVCGGDAGVNSNVVRSDFYLQPSNPVFTPGSSSNLTTSQAVAITLAQPPNCYGNNTCTGAVGTANPYICYTTDNSAPAFNNLTCAPSATTTCTQTPEVDLVLDQWTQVRATTCSLNMFGGNSASATYSFNQYTRNITAAVGSMTGGTVPFTTGYPNGGDGKFYDPENSLGTSDPGYGFWHSYTSTTNFTSGGTFFWGVKGVDIGVDNTTHVTSVYLNEPIFLTGANATTTPNTAATKSAAALPAPAHWNLACVNSATQNVVNCTFWAWNGAAWQNVASGFGYARNTAAGELLMTIGYGGFRRAVSFGAINVGGTDTVGFPGPGIYTNWVDAELESYRAPSDPTFKH